MEMKDLIDVFDREVQCEYKDRQYLVRDNGAICRLPKEGCRPSKLDNVWTFGTKNLDGYMIFTGNIRVHQVVCTAFHGPEPQPHMVVDHKDINRCNNRPENLRWLTRLENALNNDATRKKIIYLCGSIEAFIENPSILRTKALSTDISWMRTVTKEEAAACKKHIEEWSRRDSKQQSSRKGIGEWVFSDDVLEEGKKWMGEFRYPSPYYKSWEQQKLEIEEMNRKKWEEDHALKDSLTPGAKQLNWVTPTEFLLCPHGEQERTLNDYLNSLVKGEVFTRTQYGDGGTVLDAGINDSEDALYVLTFNAKDKENGFGKPWALCRITVQDGFYIHENKGSFFQEVGGLKYYTLAIGQKWSGGEVFDDLC